MSHRSKVAEYSIPLSKSPFNNINWLPENYLSNTNSFLPKVVNYDFKITENYEVKLMYRMKCALCAKPVKDC